jgi:Family of unknown function (DUF5924)/Protein of unknown function (DUF2914)
MLTYRPKVPSPPPIGTAAPPRLEDGSRGREVYWRIRRFFREHGRKLWWLHSAYALGLGISVVAFAQKGFEHARWLCVTLGLAWLTVVVFFRLFGSGAMQAPLEIAAPKTKLRFYAMTYLLKNLYQGMLFFLLPFYWKSTTSDAPNVWFVALLGTCAVLSTLDIVFDRVLMRRRWAASVFHGFILFACLNLVVPALFPDVKTLVALLVAAGIAPLGVWTLHVAPSALKVPRNVAILAASLAGSIGLAYVARAAIPPVPLHLAYEAVGPFLTKDDRLAMEVRTLDASVITQLLAVTKVSAPGGHTGGLRHVWRHAGEQIGASTKTIAHDDKARTLTLRSQLAEDDLPKVLVGHWIVDVLTEDDQLVGRAEFDVVDGAH